jgi:hypothetical protein
MLVVLTGASACLAQSAADECLPKPTGPTPQGQHWYYRIDHANNGRQCWYLRTEIPRAQKKPRQAEGDSSSARDESVPTPVQRATPTARAPEVTAERSVAAAAAPAVAPIPWLNMQRLAEPRLPEPKLVGPKLAEPLALVQPAAEPRLDTATEAAPAASPDPSPEPTTRKPAEARRETVGTAASDNPIPRGRAKEQQRAQRIQSASPLPAAAEIDHTFALLVIVLAAITIAGPALHFVERRRRRRQAVNVSPPRWARVVALNAPKPRPRVSTSAAPRVPAPPAPLPLAPPEQTERLAYALQQLVDRLRTMERPEPEAPPIQPRHASM